MVHDSSLSDLAERQMLAYSYLLSTKVYQMVDLVVFFAMRFKYGLDHTIGI